MQQPLDYPTFHYYTEERKVTVEILCLAGFLAIVVLLILGSRFAVLGTLFAIQDDPIDEMEERPIINIGLGFIWVIVILLIVFTITQPMCIGADVLAFLFALVVTIQANRKRK